LLPFHCFSVAFGQREASSLTFSLFFCSIWAERGALSYLFTVFPQHLGRERRTLLPFHCFSAAFGQREALSLTFSLFFRSIWAERSALSDHSAAFELYLGTEKKNKARIIQKTGKNRPQINACFYDLFFAHDSTVLNELRGTVLQSWLTK